MTEHIVLAAMLAAEVHAGQFQRCNNDGATTSVMSSGIPYISHVRRVVSRVMGGGYGGAYVCVAWLHDVVEDTRVTLDELRAMGFNKKVVEAVDALTKRDDESYEGFVRRAYKNSVARVVKTADVEDHLNQKNAENFHKYDKYVWARAYLLGNYDITDILFG